LPDAMNILGQSSGRIQAEGQGRRGENQTAKPQIHALT